MGMSRRLICTLFASSALLAQETAANPDKPKTKSQGHADRALSIAVPAEVIREPPMTVKQKFTYHFKQSVDPWVVLREGAGAGLDQWRDHPGGWGQGWDNYGVRVASHFGQHFIKQQMLFGVQALDHENPLHLRSSRKGFKNRALDAVRYTFVTNNDNGKPMPAYSRFVAAYGSAYVSRSWYPPSYHTFWGGISAGSSSLAIDVG